MIWLDLQEQMWTFWKLTGDNNLIMRWLNTTSCHCLMCKYGWPPSSVSCKTASVVHLKFHCELIGFTENWLSSYATSSIKRVCRCDRWHAVWSSSSSLDMNPNTVKASSQSIGAKNDACWCWRRWIAGGVIRKWRLRANTTKINQVSCRPQITK